MIKKIDIGDMLIVVILILGLIDSRNKGFDVFILYMFTALGIYLVFETRRRTKK